MTEKAGGRGFKEIEGFEKGDKAEIGEFTCLLQSVHRFVDAEKEEGFAVGGVLDEGKEVKVRKDRVGEEMGVEFDVLGRGKVGAKVEVRQIDGPKDSIS